MFRFPPFYEGENDVNIFNRAIFNRRPIGTDAGRQTACHHRRGILWSVHFQMYATIKEETMDFTCTLLVTLIFMSMLKGIVIMLLE